MKGMKIVLKNLTHINEDREEGFSLVELLVVIVIIGILSAIAIGAFLNQRKKANDAAVQSDMKMVINEIHTLLADDPNGKSVFVGMVRDDPSVDNHLRISIPGSGASHVYLSKDVIISSSGNVSNLHTGTYGIRGLHRNGDKYRGTASLQNRDTDRWLTWSASTGKWDIRDGYNNVVNAD